MKLTVLVALLASTASADKCQPGMKYEVFSNDRCEGKPIESSVYSDEDASKSNQCKSYIARKEYEQGQKYARMDLKDAAKRMMQLKRQLYQDDITIQDPLYPGYKLTPPDMFEDKYAELEHLYFKWQESEEEFQQQLKGLHPQEKHAIYDYRDAYHNYYIVLHKPGNIHEDEVIEAKKELDNAAKKIRGLKVSIETIQNAEKIKIEEYRVFNELVPDHPGPDYTQVERDMEINRRHMGLYLRRAYALHKAEIAYNEQKKDFDAIVREVDEQTYSTYTSCDTKGVMVSVYDDPGCNRNPDAEYFAAFGECTQWGDKYYKITQPQTAMTDAIEFDQD